MCSQIFRSCVWLWAHFHAIVTNVLSETKSINVKGPRTVLMKDCQLKWPEKSFKESDIFSMKKIVGSTLDLSTKAVFLLDKYQLKKWVENSVFAIQHIENRKRFIEVLLPPPPLVTKLILFAYICSFTFHTSYKNGMIGHGGGTLSKCSETLNS